ncbi:hypothetical protein ACFV42_23280 [Streptomyces solisilvae]|uniref:hypothetical protein n=1 Tax=Streptomyces malaysiensis TaxID=92644 RepID=UPI0036D15092
MSLKDVAITAVAVAFAATAAVGVSTAVAADKPQYNASQLSPKEKAFMDDLSAVTGNPKSLRKASPAEVKKIATVFKGACSSPASERRAALGNPLLKGKLSNAKRDKLGSSWEKNLCKG